MLRAVPSSPDTHGLDHRTASADPLDRYSTLSQYSDTPSVYSRAHFSPYAANDYRHDFTDDPRSHRQRLRDPNLSTLDLDDDDRRSSVSTSDTHDDDDPHSFEDPTDDDLGDRMSYLGPKMRFHSRAPWEMEAETLQEEDEPQDSPKPSGFPFSFGASFKTSSSPSTSPRPSHSAPRPSGDSYVLPSKRSFETINSQLSAKGALYTLAQESLSATSLARVNSPAGKETLLGKFSSLGRPRAPTLPSILTTVSPPSSPPLPTSPIRSPARVQPKPAIMHDADTRSHWTSNRRDSSQTRYAPSTYSACESIHPYANPDLVVTREPDPLPPSSPTFSIHPSLTRGSHPKAPQAFATAEPLRFDSIDATHRSAPRNRMSSIQGKGISSPITVQGSALPANFSNNVIASEQGTPANNLAGWTERVVPPTFNLISLEEARAQRARNSGLQDDLDRSVSSVSTTASQSTATLTQEEFGVQSSTAASIISTRSRGRTISAGAKAKNAIQTMVGSAKYERRDSEPAVGIIPVSQPAGKSLKHKKSGFMRLFNGSKDKDDAVIPPLPSHPMAQSELNTPPRKLSVSRVPVPSIGLDAYVNSAIRKDLDSSLQRLSPPNLHINVPSSHTRGTGSDGDKTRDAVPSPHKPWLNQSGPQSAPPEISSFPALRLRPVSTLFSSHFEHFVPDLQSNANDNLGCETPTTSSPNELNHPVTPGISEPYSKSENDNLSATVHSLREQLASAKQTSQRRIWELENQIKDLKVEVEQLRSKRADPYCDHCSRKTWSSSPTNASPSSSGGNTPNSGVSVINRPRAKTGTNSRFVNAYS